MREFVQIVTFLLVTVAIITAFVYVFTPAHGLKFLRTFCLPLLVLLVLVGFLNERLGSAAGLAMAIIMIIVSLVAHVLWRSRHPEKERPLKTGGVERKPLLPRHGGSKEGDDI